MSGKCDTCKTKLEDSPGGKHFKCLECSVFLCKYCYEQGTEPGRHMSSHDMRKIETKPKWSDDSDDSDDEWRRYWHLLHGSIRTLTLVFFFTIQNTKKIYALNIKGNPFHKNVMISLFVFISRAYEYCGIIIVRGVTLFVAFVGKFLPK